jgi:hypothetical protein
MTEVSRLRGLDQSHGQRDEGGADQDRTCTREHPPHRRRPRLRREAVLLHLARRAALTMRTALAATRLGLGLYVVDDDQHDVERKEERE